MTTAAVTLIESKAAENAQTTQYTSTSVVTIIDKFTATNTTAGNVTFAINLVPSGGSAATGNLMFSKTLLPGQCYTCPELVGHVLSSGDFISTLAGAATSITIRASGRQITTP